MVRDQNGNALSADVRWKLIGDLACWGVTVWFGGAMGPATEVRRYYYRTREQARRGSIGDSIGQRGRVA